MGVSLPRYLTTMYLMLALVLGLGLTAASPEPSLAESLEALTQTCDQSDNYVGILNAVHTSLDLQKRLTDLEQQVSNLEYLLSNSLPAKGKTRRDASAEFQDNVYFSVVRSEMLRCQNCPVTYAKAHVNHGAGIDLDTGVFTAPVSGSYYFQFHGLVEKGHEARVMMMLNSEVVAHMYDKDYSGDNQRFAMFGQSIIVEMRVGDRFKIVLDKGSLGVQGGRNQFISFLGHLVGKNSP